MRGGQLKSWKRKTLVEKLNPLPTNYLTNANNFHRLFYVKSLFHLPLFRSAPSPLFFFSFFRLVIRTLFDLLSVALFLFVYQKGHLGTKRFNTAAPFSPQLSPLSPPPLLPFARYDVIWLFDFCRHDKIQNVAWQLYWLMAPRPFRPFVSEGVSEACDGFNECLTPPPPYPYPLLTARCQIKAQLLFFFLFFCWPLGVALWSFASRPAASVSAASYLVLPRLALPSCCPVVLCCCCCLLLCSALLQVPQ